MASSTVSLRPLLERFCEDCVIELRTQPRQRLLVDVSDPGMAAPDLLAESLRRSEQLRGGLRPPGDRERLGEAGEILDDLAGHLEVARDAKRFSQHRQGIVDPALVAGESRQLVELGRGDCPIAPWRGPRCDSRRCREGAPAEAGPP